MFNINLFMKVILNKLYTVIILISTLVFVPSLFFDVKVMNQSAVQIISFMYILSGLAQWAFLIFLDRVQGNKAVLGKVILKEEDIKITIIYLVVVIALILLPIILYTYVLS